jgi:cardiolipin synthase
MTDGNTTNDSTEPWGTTLVYQEPAHTSGYTCDVANDHLSRRLAQAIPSLITLVRLALLVPVVLLANHRSGLVLAAILLALMGVTDFLDGFVARRLDAVTTFGKVFDPLSDRVVLIAVALVALADHLVPLWLLVLVLVREVLVALTVGLDLLVHHHRNDVVFIGKAGTFGLLAGFPLIVLADGLELEPLRQCALVVMVVALALLFGALGHYARRFSSMARLGDNRPD